MALRRWAPVLALAVVAVLLAAACEGGTGATARDDVQSPASDVLSYIQRTGPALAQVTQADAAWRGGPTGQERAVPGMAAASDREKLDALRAAVDEAARTFAGIKPPPSCQLAHDSISDALRRMDGALEDAGTGYDQRALEQADALMAQGRYQLSTCILD